MRPVVLFQFRADVPSGRQEILLARIGVGDGIAAVGRLEPDSGCPEVRRMCYAYAGAGADVSAIVERLSALPEVEGASLPAQRGI